MSNNEQHNDIGGTQRLSPPKRLADNLYVALVAMIEEELPPGSRLPSELVIADRFGVSRPTVRETLARMRDEGIISSRRGSGSYVTDPTIITINRNNPTFAAINSFQQIRHAYDFRKAVEGDAAFLAALNGSEPQINAIRLALEGLEKAVEQRTSSADVDFSFHLAITHASGNVWFTDALTAMHDQIETMIDIARKLSLGKSEAHLRAVQQEHVAIFDAIIQKDPDRARDAMRSHLTNTCDRIFSGQSF